MVLNSLGVVYQRQGRLDDALRVLQKSLAILEKQKDEKGQAMVLNSLGVVYQQKGRLDDALRVLLQSLAILEKQKDEKGQAIVRTVLGRTYLLNNQPQQSAENLIKSFEIKEKLRERKGLPKVVPFLVDALRQLGRQAEAIHYCERALAIAPEDKKLQSTLQSIRQSGKR